MDSVQICIVICVTALLAVALAYLYESKDNRTKKLSKLFKFAFTFILAGIVFGEDRLIGYILVGIGAMLAIVDILRNFRK